MNNDTAEIHLLRVYAGWLLLVLLLALMLAAVAKVNVLPINARNQLIVVGELDTICKNEIFNFTQRLF